ncbi:hypothetical protein AM1_6164 [Acaryochloris marina MBIC11017]|uniref:Uncharacterized protein n=1 Tax=Acaryochloris marina (strain MBIC 11017) TaxID=329726 RepID=B0C4V8_ACAM1|nr:hypothetical protein AM1_6164 [Acaryochloris marina MBIC11017]
MTTKVGAVFFLNRKMAHEACALKEKTPHSSPRAVFFLE